MKESMKQEAIRRLEALGIVEDVIQAFKESNQVCKSEPHWQGEQSHIYTFDGSDGLNYDTMELVEGTHATFSEDVYETFGAPARFVGDTFEREAEPFENNSEFTPFKAQLVSVLDAADTYMKWVPINDNSHYLVI